MTLNIPILSAACPSQNFRMPALKNIPQSVLIVPFTNELLPVRSMLPNRFVSDSEVQPTSILADNFGSSVDIDTNIHILIPATA